MCVIALEFGCYLCRQVDDLSVRLTIRLIFIGLCVRNGVLNDRIHTQRKRGTESERQSDERARVCHVQQLQQQKHQQTEEKTITFN